MKKYYYNHDNTFRFFFSIDYLSVDTDNVESVEIFGDSISFLFDECDLVVTCDCTDYYFDFDRIVNFRFIDYLNTQLADYL